MSLNHFNDEVIPMQFYDLKNLVGSTADAAFAVDGDGNIVLLNAAAEQLLGVDQAAVVGQSCSQVLCGEDACGITCSPQCSVRQATENCKQVKNYDLKVQTPQGRQWCNITVLLAEVSSSTRPYSIHIMRTNDVQKRLELLMTDFIVKEASLSEEGVKSLASVTRSPAREANLSIREKEILKLLVKGNNTSGISRQLNISRTTVNNHIQHILQKLNVHTRLEAIRLAEHSGLV